MFPKQVDRMQIGRRGNLMEQYFDISILRCTVADMKKVEGTAYIYSEQRLIN